MPDIAYIELVEGLGVEVADEELGAVVDVALVLLDQDTVEVSGFGLTLAAADDVASESSLGSSVDEALADQDLGADDDGGGGQELGVGDGQAADETGGDDDGLHFAVSGSILGCKKNEEEEDTFLLSVVENGSPVSDVDVPIAVDFYTLETTSRRVAYARHRRRRQRPATDVDDASFVSRLFSLFLEKLLIRWYRRFGRNTETLDPSEHPKLGDALKRQT